MVSDACLRYTIPSLDIDSRRGHRAVNRCIDLPRSVTQQGLLSMDLMPMDPHSQCHLILEKGFMSHETRDCKLVRSLVRSIVRAVTKCTIVYREQTAEPRSANCCTHIHVDKIPAPANFHPNSQRS